MRDRLYAGVVFFLTLAVYSLTMPRGITLEDAGLFQMVCHLDGIAHPPGYPLFTLLCKPFVQFPHVINGNLLSALFASMTAVFFYFICRQLMADRLGGLVAALAYGFSNVFWSQAIIIEVYTLATLMFMICWWLLSGFVSSGKRGWWWAFCLTYGLALANHWPLMVLSTPGLLLLLWPVRGLLARQLKSPKFVGASFGLLLLGLTPYVSLVLNKDPQIAIYGPIDSLQEFLRYVARSAYGDAHAVAGAGDKMEYAWWLFETTLMQFGVAGVPILILGIIVGMRTLPRYLNISLLLVWLGPTYALLMMIDFHYDDLFRAVFKPYPIIGFSAISLWFAAGVSALIKSVGSHFTWARGAIAVAAVLLVFLSNYGKNNRSESQLVARFGEAVLNSLPPNAVLFVSGDNETGVLGYLHHVRHIRPDVELLDWESLVFANRLTSAYASTEASHAAARAWIERTDRPVFSLKPRLSPAIDYGAYFKRASVNGFAFAPELEAYLDYLLAFYNEGYLHESHEAHFAFHLLMDYGRQYLGFALVRNPENLSDVRRGRIMKMQQTFPGRLVTLETIIEAGAAERDKSRLLEIATAAEANIPKFATLGSLAVFYGLYAKVHMIPPANQDRAKHYFRLSMESYPVSKNNSICSLMRIYRTEDDDEALAHLRQRFTGVDC